MKLVEDWKDAYKWLSINIAVVMGALNALQASVPHVQALLSPSTMAWVNAALGVAIIWGRLIQQGGKQT